MWSPIRAGIYYEIITPERTDLLMEMGGRHVCFFKQLHRLDDIYGRLLTEFHFSAGVNI